MNEEENEMIWWVIILFTLTGTLFIGAVWLIVKLTS